MTDHATAEGTGRYAARFSRLPDNFRPMAGLAASSVGLGTYLGEADDATDILCVQAVEDAIASGINVIDTAINYRFQRAERSIGQALRQTFATSSARRDELIIASKGGYLTFDGGIPADPREFFKKAYVDTGLIAPGELVDDSHCMAPRYLEAMLDRSLQNLGLKSLDVYFLHNPEAQLGAVDAKEFETRIRRAFEMLERKVAQGLICRYGVATWNGFRVPAASHEHLSLSRLLELALEIGGPDHHFKVIQLPFNLAMPEALTLQNQRLEERTACLLEVARDQGVAVWASASLLQGRLARDLPPFVGEAFEGLSTDAQRALQFVRSTPGIQVALVGMKSPQHLGQTIDLMARPPAAIEAYSRLFKATD